MQELLRVIVENLVTNKDAIIITESLEEDGAILLHLRVADEDVGKVIGKQGKIAKAIRTVVKSAASFKEKKVIIKIM
ncbi:MAG: KH domain-containing protein [bacterium]